MGILSAMLNALKSFYPELENLEEEINITVTQVVDENVDKVGPLFVSRQQGR